MTDFYITVAGNIGVGKSTLVKLLTKRLGWDAIYEAVSENPYLADFYTEMNRWSFHSQVFFLSRRLRQHHSVLQRTTSVIQDRSVYEDAEIFARNLFHQGKMAERDWNTYFELYSTLSVMLPAPDLVIYLQASVETLGRRIEQRGRAYEQGIAMDYLAQLNALYESWASDFTLGPVLTVNTDNLDYVQNDAHLNQIWDKIEERLLGRDFLSLG